MKAKIHDIVQPVQFFFKIKFFDPMKYSISNAMRHSAERVSLELGKLPGCQ
ncbi:MAG: hypothetical protein ACO1O6_05865 [Bacteroidota bacterium]